MKKTALILIGVLVSISLIAGCGATPAQKKITMNEYHSLKNDMTFSQACSAAGAFGEEVSRTERPEGKEAIVTVLYIWKNTDGSHMNAIFQNDRLVRKSQNGLK